MKRLLLTMCIGGFYSAHAPSTKPDTQPVAETILAKSASLEKPPEASLGLLQSASNPLSLIGYARDSLLMTVWPMFDSNRTSLFKGILAAMLISCIFSGAWYMLYRSQVSGWSKELFSGITLKLDVNWTSKYLSEHLVLFVKSLGVYMLIVPAALIIQHFVNPRIISTISQNAENQVKFDTKLPYDRGIADMRDQLAKAQGLASETRGKIASLLYALTFTTNLPWLMLGILEMLTLSGAFYALSPISGALSVTIPGLGAFTLLSGPSSLYMYISFVIGLRIIYKLYQLYSAFKVISQYNHKEKNSKADKKEYLESRDFIIQIAPPSEPIIKYLYKDIEEDSAKDESSASTANTSSESDPQDMSNKSGFAGLFQQLVKNLPTMSGA